MSLSPVWSLEIVVFMKHSDLVLNTHIIESIVWSSFDDNQEIFGKIYKKNLWSSNESVSGKGSEYQSTINIRRELPLLFEKYKIKTLIDAPCGDYSWFKNVSHDLDRYIGIDIVPELISINSKYSNEKISFKTADLLNYNFECVDMILCRDCFIHLTNKQINIALSRFRVSNSRYLLTTNFDKITYNEDILTGQYRPINLEIEPFCLGKPILNIVEDVADGKSISLWSLGGVLDDE